MYYWMVDATCIAEFDTLEGAEQELKIAPEPVLFSYAAELPDVPGQGQTYWMNIKKSDIHIEWIETCK